MVYKIKEDSLLLAEATENIKNSFCLDMGCGNFLISEILLKNNNKVVAIDIDYEVFLQKKFDELKRNENFYYLNSNLFKPLKTKFDYIFFNPPYLPYDKREGFNYDTTGGKKGWEITINFLKELHNYLKIEGKCFLIVSNFTKNKVDNFLKTTLYDFEIKGNKKFYPFEEIWLYEIKFNNYFQNLDKESKNFLNKINFEFYSKGKRSVIIKYENDKLIKIGETKTIKKEYFYLNYIDKKLKKVFKEKWREI